MSAITTCAHNGVDGFVGNTNSRGLPDGLVSSLAELHGDDRDALAETLDSLDYFVGEWEATQ